MDDAQKLTENLAEERERVRRAKLYQTTIHPRKWERFGKLQERRFRSATANAKLIFDCLGMVAFSASIFGFAVAAHISQPMNELCERSVSISFVLLGLLGLATAALAFQPIRHWAAMNWAASQKENLKPYPFRVAAQRYGGSFVDWSVWVAYVAVIALAYSIAHNIASRVPEQVCTPPLP